MARSTGPVLIAGGMAAANVAIFAPLAAHRPENWGAMWRLVPATAGLALGLALLEKAAPGFAVGLAWLVVVGVLVFPVEYGQTSLLDNVNKTLHL